MKIYKEGGLTVFCPKEIKLNRHEKGFLSKTKDGRFHMDIYGRKGPAGSSVDFGSNLLDSVLKLLK